MDITTCITALSIIPDAAIIVEQSGIISHANSKAEQLFGYGHNELAGLHVSLLVPENKRIPHAVMMADFMAKKGSRPQGTGLPLAGCRKDGSVFPADITLGTCGDRDSLMIMATIRDISQLIKAEEELRHSNRALRLLSASNRFLLRCSREEEQLEHVCRIAVEIGGYRLAWIGLACNDEDKTVFPAACHGEAGDFLKDMKMSWAEGKRGTSAMSTAIRTGTVQLRQDILNDPLLAPWHEHARANNYQSAIALPLRVQNEVIGALAIYAPEPNSFNENEVALLTELAEDLNFGIHAIRLKRAHEDAQAHVKQLAYYDRLTGLPNRIAFMEELERSIAIANAEAHTFALLLLDLNYLREVNEAHGHAVGDQILVRVAWQMQQIIGRTGFVARFSGNDFTIICPDMDQFGAAGIGNHILSTISAPFVLAEHQFVISGNIGVACYPGDGEDSGDLLSKVDLAMSRAKEIGSGVCFYRPEMGQRLARRLELANRLERAMKTDQLQLYYQSKVELASGVITGAEALLRWHDPDLGWISPAEFIPVAESRGMMIELGTWVLRTACIQIRKWLDSGLLQTGRIAVNVSARQLDDPGFLETAGRILQDAGISSQYLELELTESALMSDPEQVIGLLTELKELGFSLAIDDFGTGYSSLAYLKRFSVDTLKIDQAFVRDMLEDQNDLAIVSTIIAMAQQLGLTPVAEGVELDSQRIALQKLGCTLAQGYYFSRPEPADAFAARCQAEVSGRTVTAEHKK